MKTEKENVDVTETLSAVTASEQGSVFDSDRIGNNTNAELPLQTVQDHATVVIPYCKDFAQGKELLFALRSWQKNVRFGINVVIIGDREDWFSDEITFIEHQRISENAHADILAKLQVAIQSSEVTERFIFSCDDIYVMNPIGLAHIEIPKVLGQLKLDNFTGIYADDMKRTKELLENRNLPCLNYDTHTPMLFSKSLLSDMLTRFPQLQTDGYLFSSLYYNSLLYPVQPLYLDWRIDQVLLPVVSQEPDEKKVLELLSHKIFMNNAVSGYSSWLERFLDDNFSFHSDFEV